MAKMSYEMALDAINDGRLIRVADVQSRALKRRVWVAESHIPGCMSESQSYCRTKRDAINTALSMAEGEDGPPRGMRAELEKIGRSERTAPDDYVNCAITTVYALTLSDLLNY